MTAAGRRIFRVPPLIGELERGPAPTFSIVIAAHNAAGTIAEALESALAEPGLCLMCAETLWTRCHRRLIAELLFARGEPVVHLLGPTRREPHRLFDDAEIRDGRLYLCGAMVA